MSTDGSSRTKQAAAPADEKVVAACPACGQKNRLLKARLLDQPTCGRCKQPLFGDQPVPVNEATWQAEVEGSPLPVLVDFWAPWCSPCRTIAPVMDAIAKERAGRWKVAKVNVDENPALAARFGIQAIPTLVLVRGGVALDQIRGAPSRTALDARLNRIAA
jgi:thioredoxin 2